MFKQQAPGADTTISVFVSGDRYRSDIEITSQGMVGLRMSKLIKSSTPSKGYLINEARKSYAEFEVSSADANATHSYTAKLLGRAKIGKWTTTQVELADAGGDVTVVWTASEIEPDQRVFELLGQPAGGANGMKALQSVGAKGFPVKLASTRKDGVVTSLELVTFETREVPSAKFDIPSAWKKQEGSALMIGLQQDAQARVMEAMRKTAAQHQESTRTPDDNE